MVARPNSQLALAGVSFALAAWLAWILFSATLPPGIDTPQHIVQSQLFLRLLAESPYRAQSMFQLQLEQPYYFGVLPSALFLLVLPPVLATQLVFFLYAVSLVFVAYLFLHDTEADPWWCLLTLPVAFGAYYRWGLLAHLVALPANLLALHFLRREFERGPRRGALLALWMCILVAGHLPVACMTILIAGAYALASPFTPRELLRRIAVLIPAVLLVLVWALSPGAFQGQSLEHTETWQATRVLEIGSQLLWSEANLDAASWFILASVTFLAVARPSLRPGLRGWLPFLAALGMALFLPYYIGGAFLALRVLFFIVPLFLASLRRSDNPRCLWAGRTVTVAAAVAALAVQANVMATYDREMRPLLETLDRLEPGRTMVGLVPAESGNAFGYHQYVHAPVWYAVLHGGMVDFSFAHFPQMMVGFKRSLVTREFSNEFVTTHIRPHLMHTIPLLPYEYALVRADNPDSTTQRTVVEHVARMCEAKFQHGAWLTFICRRTEDTTSSPG